MHGSKSDPNYAEKYHPGNGVKDGTRTRKKAAISGLRERVHGYVEGGQSGPFRRGTEGINGDNISYTLDPALAKELNDAGMSTPVIEEITDTQLFIDSITDAKASTKFGSSVSIFTPEEYSGMRLFLTPDGTAGFALNGEDIVSVFNHAASPYRGVSPSLMGLAIQEGGRTLQNFDTYLPKIYARMGFVEVARYPWDEEQKVADWDYDTYHAWNDGRPDYLFMEYDQ
jgi:hypothetical protein